MKDKQVIEAVVKKAMENGFNEWTHFEINPSSLLYRNEEVVIELEQINEDGYLGDSYEQFRWGELIFNHDFAKAFFGEEKDTLYCIDTERRLSNGRGRSIYYDKQRLTTWQYHLQQLVILTDDKKLEYLKEFINRPPVK